MKTLMLTTAMVTATAIGAAAQSDSAALTGQNGAPAAVPAFLASDFTGKTLYTLDTEDARAIGDTAASDEATLSMADRDRLRWTSSDTFVAARDDWQSVGAIDDIVMTKDGEIRGILLDVGGFLGFGARTVMVEIEQLYFVSDEGAPEEIGDFFVVISMSQEQLENLPEWNEDQLRTGFELRAYPDDTAGTDVGQAAPTGSATATGEGMHGASQPVFGTEYSMLEGEERTADRLIGADVYDAQGDNIGSVDDVVIGADNGIEAILVDVGGFLGIGAHTVMLPIESAEVGWSDADGDVRVQVSMTAEQLEAMPEHDS